ncbi:MAG TPA: MoxR family ATPase [Trebonia sp.]
MDPSTRNGAAEPAEGSGMDSWPIYRGDSAAHDGIAALPEPPPWRKFGGEPVITTALEPDADLSRRLGGLGHSYRPDEDVIEAVNAALYLRRPLLVTGKPGTGKSTLAYSVAYELRLGPVLYWPISSRSTLAEGLYSYDAIGRLQEAGLRQTISAAGQAPYQPRDVGRYIRLGPLGTGLLPWRQPRVLLIDELDKSDIDLPNDLLNVFEEGRYEIPELARVAEDQPLVEVGTADALRLPIRHGSVLCRAFPFVVITSNGERQFPPPFLRRCVRLDIQPPDRDALVSIVTAQLGPEAAERSNQLIEDFLRRRQTGDIATDQLLNAIYLALSGSRQQGETRERLTDKLLRALDSVAYT